MKPRRLTMLVLVSLALAPAAARRAIAAPGEESIDDPKMSRRLGTRVDWSAAQPTDPPTTVEPIATVESTPPAASEAHRGEIAPRLQLAYRRFSFVRIGASGGNDGTAASEPFNAVSIDVYPLSTFVRVGLSTQYGWQSGGWLSSADYFAAEALSAGGQWTRGTVSPFAEGFAGVGYMRRLQFERTIPTAFWQFGADVGADVYFSRAGFVSLALGYLHAVNGFAKVQQFETIFVDTWSFKLGIGL